MKYDKINIEVPSDGLELYRISKEFIEYYNNERPHESLDYKSPTNYYKNAA
ncbi:MAG: hypothetical protein DRI84_02785 [Bacteroidetes bacterium]|nr:MAG: hypothetical protein DRI84_02785 [Bacteroidota bacterium]